MRRSFGSNPGNLRIFKHVPTDMPEPPVIVALHGWTQNSRQYAERTEWNKLADRGKFYMVYAEQKSLNNLLSCFNWFERGDITRGKGEALSTKEMVDKMKSDYAVDPDSVSVTGLSAGRYMTTVMLATYVGCLRRRRGNGRRLLPLRHRCFSGSDHVLEGKRR
jgi:poly(hydroxyalkanoate) depolymerase family esterase